MSQAMRIGILTSGGDCPGLNAVIRGFGKYVVNQMKDVQLIGIADGYGGLINQEYRELKESDFSGILTVGGTILGTSRQPFKTMTIEDQHGTSKLEQIVQNYKKMNLDLLVTLGGAGTHKTAALLASEGCRIIGLPKTIDNDIWGTDVTFGFHTAVDIATECLDRIHTTAESHGRTMLVELMGNKVGWLTLYAGIAAGADIIIIPEIPYTPEIVAKEVVKRRNAGKAFTIIAIAEGAKTVEEAKMKKNERQAKRNAEGTVSSALAQYISEKTGVETRVVVPGHLQRGGSPSAYDRVLSTEMGNFAGQLAQDGISGVTVAINGPSLTYNALMDIAGKTKFVPEDNFLIKTAKGMGVSFGDGIPYHRP
jgi:6-phosphofructokinase